MGIGSLGTSNSQLASSNNGLSAAAKRAAAAAASVGEVEPFKPSRRHGKRRQTLKVVWRPDRELVAVRRFLQVGSWAPHIHSAHVYALWAAQVTAMLVRQQR